MRAIFIFVYITMQLIECWWNDVRNGMVEMKFPSFNLKIDYTAEWTSVSSRLDHIWDKMVDELSTNIKESDVEKM